MTNLLGAQRKELHCTCEVGVIFGGGGGGRRRGVGGDKRERFRRVLGMLTADGCWEAMGALTMVLRRVRSARSSATRTMVVVLRSRVAGRGDVDSLVCGSKRAHSRADEELVSLCHHQSNAPRPDEAAEAEATALDVACFEVVCW
jgi:hypothetical protein